MSRQRTSGFNGQSLKFVLSTLRFHARSHAGTLLGVIVATAVLVGALTVGDCMRQSLRDLNLARLGKVEWALNSGDHFFRSTLADDFQEGSPQRTAPCLLLPGIAANPDGSARANRVQILGVDNRFWNLAESSHAEARRSGESKTAESVAADESVILNTALARQLGVKVGDTILVRVRKPSLLSAEAPMSPREDVAAAMRLPVRATVSDAEFGRFGLQSSQLSPLNAFIPLSVLQNRLGLGGKANLLLVSQSPTHVVNEPSERLKKVWKLADAGVELRSLPASPAQNETAPPSSSTLELRSERVFLDPLLLRATLSLVPQAQVISTYFVNELRVGERATPYSMVTAIGAPIVPADMRDAEMVINQWLADDLQAKAGDTIQIAWLVLGNHQLEERRGAFRVRAVIPMEGPAADPTLMPEFPGLAKAEKTADWDAGFKIDMGNIRPKDEQYWKEHRGTPKAFVTLNAGRQMWGSRFGDITSVRFPKDELGLPRVESALRDALDPASLGLVFQPVRQQALAASAQSQDFSGLFLGFSFFLIVAALILVGVLFQFALEKRAHETGILLALGLRPSQVRRFLLIEGAALAVAGGLIGVAGGVLYAKAVLYGLTTLWRAAVGTSALAFYVSPSTLLIGFAASVVINVVVIYLALRRQTKQPARQLLELGHELESLNLPKSKRHWDVILAILSVIAGAALIAKALLRGDTADVEAFFGGGALFLIAGLSTAAVWLRRIAAAGQGARFSAAVLCLRGCGRRRGRSLATIALLASGCFLIVAVEANKLDATQQANQRASGTGGFALVAESALPIAQDLNSKQGRDFYGLRSDDLAGVDIVPMRVRDGDDASCLNLNRAQTPRLLGVEPALLHERGAFSFTRLADEFFRAKPWLLLNEEKPDEIPAIADEASILWALDKKVGDTLDYLDERGRKFKVRLVGALANSILQGNLIISEAAFTRRFPGEAGCRMFLIDCPAAQAGGVGATLSRQLQDTGLEVTSAAARLNAFNAVQNTYLNTFQVLGALGLLLGSAGLGVVVLRNVLERRAEFALFLAVGFRRTRVRRLVLGEHVALLCAGLFIGLSAAAVALVPVLFAPGAAVPLGSLAMALSLIFLCGLLSAWAATTVALSGELLQALRNE